MKGGKKTPLGYTIIEVLIVLAVSGVMFIIAVNFINGKQGRASFTQGTNEMASQIQAVIEQITDGQYSDIPLTCTFDGTTTNASVNTAVHANGSDSNEGINSQCVFLGKVLSFHNANNPNYDVVSLAAGRVTQDAGGNPVTPTLSNIGPTVITGGLTRTQSVPQNLTIKSIRISPVGGAPNITAFNFGFAEGLGAVEAATFKSGAQTISMIYSPAPNVTGAGLAYARSAVMCMTDGTRFAQILVGGATGNASQLSVRVQVVPTC